MNESQKEVLFNKLLKHFNGDIAGKTVALWGLSFKPDTDDIREATSLVLIDRIIKAGGKVKTYDPVAMDEVKHRIGNVVEYAADLYEAVLGADALLLVTEWKEFRLPSWVVVKKIMNQPVVIDGRNIYDSQEMTEHGFSYYCIGK